MFCKNCGAQIDDSVSFCTSCGTKVERERRPEAVPAAREIQPGAVTPVQREAAASAEEETRTEVSWEDTAAALEKILREAGSPLPQEQAASAETAVPLPPPAIAQRKEKLFFGMGALVFCLILIAALSVSTGVFAGLYFSLISRI